MKTNTRLTVLAAVLLILTSALRAQVPQLLNYQGRVAVGAVNFDGSGQFKFALLDNVGQATAGPVALGGGGVFLINVARGGAGYATPPAVAITGGGGSGATVTAILSGSTVAGITVSNSGSGYTSFPTVTISPPPTPLYATVWSNDGTGAGGSESANSVTLPVTRVLYSVLLGDVALPNMNAIPASVFSSPDVRLRVWFNDGTNGFQLLAPDQRIAAAG